MANYDFRAINDKEFEVFVVDLLGQREGKTIERFRPGRDTGVDGRFFSDRRAETIVQCKHWIRSGTTALLKHLKAKEVEKVKKLKPARYILVTSCELSYKNKKDIREIFSPWIRSDSDVLGYEDLTDLLEKNPLVERRHFKLWLNSTGALQSVLHADVLGRSAEWLRALIAQSRLYVATSHRVAALERLNKLHTLIVTGEPGAGKTTLANQLCLELAANDFEVVVIERSVSEAERVIESTRKQLFFFDDFLGRNYLAALTPHEDTHIAHFIRRIGQSGNKRFILTSRTTILNQGKRLTDVFELEKLDRNEYELVVSSLTAVEKARILYNHIWFGGLSEDYVQELYKDKRYREIIYHQNFNPRLISFITDAQRIKDVAPAAYWNHVLRTLNKPADVWDHVVRQLGEASAALLFLVALYGEEIDHLMLHEAFVRYSSRTRGLTRHEAKAQFDQALPVVVGAVVNRTMTVSDDENVRITYDLFSPSIGDYVLATTSGSAEALSDYYCSLSSPGAIDNLRQLKVSKIVSTDVFIQVLRECGIAILDGSPKSGDLLPYGLAVCAHIVKELDSSDPLWQRAVSFTVQHSESVPHSDLRLACRTLRNALSKDLVSVEMDVLHKRLLDLIAGAWDDVDFTLAREMLDYVEEDAALPFTLKINEEFKGYLRDNIEQVIEESGIVDGFFSSSEGHEAYDRVEEFVEERFRCLEVDFDSSDVRRIVDRLDIDSIIEGNARRAAAEDYQSDAEEYVEESEVPDHEIIDDLFDPQFES